MGYFSNIAFDPSGNAWVSFEDNSSGDIWTANYVGSGGNCDNNNGGSDEWDCTLVATISASTLEEPSIAFDPSGNAWISSLQPGGGDLWVSQLSRAGEILVSPGLADNGTSTTITESHADG